VKNIPWIWPQKFAKSTKIKSLQRAAKPLEASNWNFLRALYHGALHNC
jgi:hypothetical protein